MQLNCFNQYRWLQKMKWIPFKNKLPFLILLILFVCRFLKRIKGFEVNKYYSSTKDILRDFICNTVTWNLDSLNEKDYIFPANYLTTATAKDICHSMQSWKHHPFFRYSNRGIHTGSQIQNISTPERV